MICKMQTFGDAYTMHIRWDEFDVHTRARALDIPISGKEARSVLMNIAENHTGDEGMSWNLIDVYLEHLKESREP